MLLALLLALQPSQSAGPEVVVTGERLKRIHDQCKAGGCAPLRDARASIAWAEAQFRDGRYVEAKRTLAASVGRNKRHAATDPKPVAAIYEAYATVAWQEGDQDVFRDAVAGRVRTLRANLPADDVHVRAAALAYGDMWLRLGRTSDADRAYREAGRAADRAGHYDVALRALLARARLRRLVGDKAGAAALLTEAEKVSGVNPSLARGAIAATRVRLAMQGEDGPEVEEALRAMRTTGLPRPVLLWSPPLPSVADPDAAGVDPTGVPVNLRPNSSTAEISAIRWADLGFWIRPDGRVAEVELLRGSRGTAWAAPYRAWVAGRRYSLFDAGEGEGVYRIERFTLRGHYGVPTDSLIRRRAGEPKLEILDLTDPAATVTAAR